MANQWIDIDLGGDFSNVGERGYLVETLNTSTGRTSLALHERPLRTNQSNEPRLAGWCGETNNRSRYARGVWEIRRFNKAMDRAQIARVEGDDLAAFLERDGYPELTPSAEPH